ncbi:MAG: SDR family NAD(P)-dependent oxidoreductase [Gemmatimonadaceae bacterium]|nr:SDR family NAD(P)-dependent oxidoreductase [Gemmatimonadaceae bacterium]
MSNTPPSRPVVVITGASSGIGAALASRLAPTHHLVLVARRADALQALAASLGRADVVTVAADVTVRSEVEDVVETALARFSRLDVWVNNVGRGITRPPSQLTDADLDDMMTVNVKSALYGMQAVLPHFRLVGRGHVINVSSMLGRVPMATFRSAYSGAKHFLNALTANMRTEVQETHPDIQFSLVSPGVVRTAFGANALHGGPDSRALPNSQSADEVADVIAQLIADRRPDVYTRAGMAEMAVGYLRSLGEDP